ncbi:hypothetical protein EON73_05340 [bacterium]|nr:MAG: hypothetical protein EON73_05340 [bacterium]
MLKKTHFNLGNCYRKKGSYPKAVEHLLQVDL